MIPRTHRSSLLILGLTWLAFVLRVYHLTYQSLWRDEVDTLRFATRTLPALLTTFRKPGENGPLFFLAMRPWLKIAGHSEFALRFPSALAGALAVPIVYVLVRRLAGSRPALVTALLAATAPYLVWYGQEAKMYALLTVLVPLSLWLTVEAAQRGGWWRWGLLYIVTSLGFYTHVLAVLVVPLQVLWLLILPTDHRPARRWLTTTGYLAVLVLPYLPLVWWEAKLWLSPTFETGHPFVPLPDILTVLAVAFSRGVLPVGTPLTLLPVMAALLAGIGLWAGDHGQMTTWRVVALLLTWLLLPPMGIYGISLGMPIFADRYLIWVMPAFLALIAMGVVALTRVWRPLGMITLGAILALNLVGVWQQAQRPVKADFRSAAHFVMAHQQAGDLLIFQIPYNRFTFRYYDGDKFNWMDGPYTNGGMSETELASQMSQGTAQAKAAWLIASEVPMWDQRGLTQAWLAAHGTVTDRAQFTRVSVTRYKLSRK